MLLIWWLLVYFLTFNNLLPIFTVFFSFPLTISLSFSFWRIFYCVCLALECVTLNQWYIFGDFSHWLWIYLFYVLSCVPFCARLHKTKGHISKSTLFIFLSNSLLQFFHAPFHHFHLKYSINSLTHSHQPPLPFICFRW